jgi:uncharacterized protein (DUF2384 family)
MTVISEVMRSDLVDTVDVAQVLGTTPRSVARWQQGDASPRRESVTRLLELKAVLDLASKVMRPDSARIWLRSPVPDLDYYRPLDLIEAGEFRRVVISLTALAEGLTA